MTVPELKINRTEPAEPTRNDLSGMHVTEAGEGVLQTPCGEFDSHRLQILPLIESLRRFTHLRHFQQGEIVMFRVLRNRTAAVNCHSNRQSISGTRFVSTSTRKDHDYVSAKKRVKTTRKRTTLHAA